MLSTEPEVSVAQELDQLLADLATLQAKVVEPVSKGYLESVRLDLLRVKGRIEALGNRGHRVKFRQKG